MGRKCDACEPYHYKFSTDGCKPCECDTVGSVSLQCDGSGQCPVSIVNNYEIFYIIE